MPPEKLQEYSSKAAPADALCTCALSRQGCQLLRLMQHWQSDHNAPAADHNTHLLHIIQQAVTTACAPEDDIHAECPDLGNAGAIWRESQRQHHRTAHDLWATNKQQL